MSPSAGSFADLLPSKVQYTISPPDIKALIPLGNSNLSLVLLYEARHLASRPPGIADQDHEQTDGTPAWGFLELTATVLARQSMHGQWFESMPDAVEAVGDLHLGDDGRNASRAGERACGRVAGSRRERSQLIGLGVPGAAGPEEEEVEDGEGSTPGAYGHPEDFWAGYNDDDDKTEEAHGPAPEAVASEESEDDYWARYGSDEQGEGLANDRTHIRHLSRITEGDEEMIDIDMGSPLAPSEADSEASLPPIPNSPVRPESMNSSGSSDETSTTSTVKGISLETASRVSLNSPTPPISPMSLMSPMSKSRLFAPLPPAPGPGPSLLRKTSDESLETPNSPSTTPRAYPLRAFSNRDSLIISPGPSRDLTPKLSQVPYPSTSSPRLSYHSSAPPNTESPRLSQLPATLATERNSVARAASPTWPPTPGSESAYSVMTDPRHSVAPVHAPLEEVWGGYKRKGVEEEEMEEDERLKAVLQGVWAMWAKGRRGSEAGEVGRATLAARWRRVTDEIALI